MKNKIYHLVILALFLITTNGFSQNFNLSHLGKCVQWTLNEKMRYFHFEVVEKKGPQGKSEFKLVAIPGNKAGDNPISNDSEHESEVHAAINPTDSNNIVVSHVKSSASGLTCPIYFTKDFGDIWTKSSFVNMPNTPGTSVLGGGNPVFVIDEDGRAYFSWIELFFKPASFDTAFWGLYWASSVDGGVTWQKPADNTIEFGYININNSSFSGGVLSDKQWMAVDRTNTARRNNLYIAYFEINPASFTGRIVVKTKLAGSSLFSRQPAVVSWPAFVNVQFTSIDVDPLSHVHVTFFGAQTTGNYALWHSVSTDGGKTFSSPDKISDMQVPQFSSGQQNVTITGIDNDRLYPSPYLAIDQNSGNLYVTWTANGITQAGNSGLDIYFSRSVDGGITWDTTIIVNNDAPGKGTDQFYSSVFVSKNGRICLSWYDRRGDPNNVHTHYYLAESFDDGQSFGSDNIVVTSTPTDFSTVINPPAETFGIGEYTQVIATDNYTIPVWSDGRKNSGDMNLYMAFIHKNVIGLDKIRVISDNFILHDAYPNPAYGSTTICFSLSKPSNIRLSLINNTGQRILTLADGYYKTGNHKIDIQSLNLSAGVYYYSLETDFGFVTKALVLQ